MIAVVRVEERVAEVKEVVRSSHSCHGGWVAMEREGGTEVITRVEAVVDWETERSSNNRN